MSNMKNDILSIGMAVASAISFNVNQSIIWAIVHGFLGWFYVIYYAIIR